MKNPCENHDDMATRVAKIEANVELILAAIKRIEDRIYQNHGSLSRLVGAFAAVVGISGAIGALVAKTM